MTHTNKKYRLCALVLLLALMAGGIVACSSAGRRASSRTGRAPIFDHTEQTTPADTAEAGAPVPEQSVADTIPTPNLPDFPPLAFDSLSAPDSVIPARPDRDSTASAPHANRDSTGNTGKSDLTALDILRDPDVEMQTGGLNIIADSAGHVARKKDFLEHPVVGAARDSLVYSVRDRVVFVYGDGNLTYEEIDMKADHIRINVPTTEIYGVGMPDTAGVMSRPELTQGSSVYTMDTITHNLSSGKTKVKGVATKDGEGFLLGRDMKKMPDNTINIGKAMYTTCDHIEHPHFYIAMTKAKVIPGKKIITGPAYFVMEDVPIYFLGIPGGFFPISTGPTAGFIMPTYGEESQRGFYLRDGGYYFRLGDYADLELKGDVYSLGSWSLKASSSYIVRYKFNGRFSADYARTIIGKNSTNYSSSGEFGIKWNHSQAPTAKPGQTFSASVDFRTAGYTKSGTTNLQDHLNTSTSSSISYGRSWTVGTTNINLTTSFNLSTLSRDTTVSITLPNISFSVSSFAPFKRKNIAAGKPRWYENITMSYSMSAQNSTGKVKESELFTKETLQKMSNGVSHNIPIKTSINIGGIINFSPSFTYNEVWNFQRQRQVWDPDMGTNGQIVKLDPEFGFFRTYNWNAAGSFSTKLYGTFQFKRKPGKIGGLEAIRHVVTPTVGFSYAPNFRHPRYGFGEYIQSNQAGQYQWYEPAVGSPRIGASGPSASVNFSLSNQIEMKVRSRRDSSEVKKIPVIEQLSFSGSYDFLRDSNNLSNIAITLRTGNIVKNFGIQLSASWDPYRVVNVNGAPVRTKDFNIGGGKFGHITNTSWSFGYTFNSKESSQPAMNDINSSTYIGAYANPYDMSENLDPAMRRMYMTSTYYDFSIPWNFGFNYSVSYSNNGLRSTITQTLGFQGSVNLTKEKKWGINFNGGFDIAKRRLTPMNISLARDLHCWSMSFQWIPFGTMKSYSFHIGIKSGMLADIKYDKQSSIYDNLRE